MEAEIIFSGLCAFHNLHDRNETMPEPSVILVRTDVQEEAPEEVPEEAPYVRSTPQLFSACVNSVIREKRKRGPKDRRKKERPDTEGPAPRASDVHIPHISFDSRTVRVNEDAAPLFQPIAFAEEFKSLQLNGIEIVIENDPPSSPIVDESYDTRVVHKDRYWPEAKNLWNRDFVPERGNQPKRTAVVGFMRFGSGRIAAGNDAPKPWRFERDGEVVLEDTFATEVVYSGFPHSGNEVVVRLLDVETRELVRELRFSPMPGTEKVTLFIGNNDEDDIDDAVQRLKLDDSEDSVHFKFLNRLAAIPEIPGLTPTVVHDPARLPNPDRVAGVTSGPCGPIGSNGG